MAEIARVEDIWALTSREIAALPDAELVQLHHRLHQLYGAARARGEATEYRGVNVHVWVVEEMQRRGMEHHRSDELDAETERLTRLAPVPAWLSEQLATAGEAVLVPAYVSLVGSATESATPRDVDVLLREDDAQLTRGWRESVLLLVRRLLDPLKQRGLSLHLLANPQGPHLPAGRGYIPLYDLVLRPRAPLERVTRAAPALPGWERWLDQAPAGLRVDLGPGPEGPPAGFVGLGRPHDLAAPWPLEDASVAVLRANHVFEHLPEPVHALNAAWRVLQPGGLLLVTVPAADSPGAVAHPEHRSLWNLDSFRFWTDPQLFATIERRPPAPFELLYLAERREGPRCYIDAVLRKPRPAEAAVAARQLVPITTFTPPKPAMKGRAHTEAFTPDEIWDWVQQHLAAGVVAEPKYNGFRAILQHRHPDLSLRFEDSQQERAPALLAADPRLERLHELPACILDCDLGVVEGGHRWARPRLMTLTADRPELPAGAHIQITAFDVLYWDGEALAEQPFAARRAALEAARAQLAAHGIAIPPERVIRTRADLDAAWQSPEFGRADMSEGLVLKARDWVYRPGPATDGMAKIKHALEVKALVLETKQTADGQYNFRGGLLPGRLADRLRNLVPFRGQQYVDLGYSFNAPFRAAAGDIITAEVEEITWDAPEGRLTWLGAKPLDIDRERDMPYAAAQVLDLARRARVLAAVPAPAAKAALGEEPETRGEAALRHWEAHWHEAMPTSGRALPFIVHAHWRGLTEAETRLDLDALLATDNSLHFDLRLGTDRFDGWWGISLFAGTTAENRDELRIFRMQHDPEERLASAPKQFGPAAWLRVGRPRPLVVPPAGVGSTSKSWSKFFAVDWGTWRLGMARQHAVEIWLEGRHLRGRFLWQYAELAGERQWLFTRPVDQRPYAATHALAEVLRAVRARGQRWLFWPRDPRDLARGLVRLDARQAAPVAAYQVVKREDEQRYTLGVAYPANRIDAHGDYTTAAELERAAWQFMRRVQMGKAGIGLMHQPGTDGAGTVVESYIYRGPTWQIGEQVVEPGDWLLGVIWDEMAWARIRRGEITGYSIQGFAHKAPA